VSEQSKDIPDLENGFVSLSVEVNWNQKTWEDGSGRIYPLYYQPFPHNLNNPELIAADLIDDDK
jgi:hypothetical protein